MGILDKTQTYNALFIIFKPFFDIPRITHNMESEDNYNTEFKELVVVSTISEYIVKYINKIPSRILSLIGKQ